jgi:hypothetical protein
LKDDDGRYLEDALEGCVTEQQSYWARFTSEDRAVVMRARAKVLGNRPVGVASYSRD